MRKQQAWGDRWLGTLKPLIADHARWLDRGRSGPGRIVLVDEECRGAKVRGLEGAKFERCDLSGLAANLMADVELVNCAVDDALLMWSDWANAQLRGGTFRGSFFGFAKFEHATIADGDWLGADLARTTWRRCHVQNGRFRGCRFVDCVMENVTYEDCDFMSADFSRADLSLDLARCPGTRFVNCDFRNANFEGFRVGNAWFENCQFFGMKGKPSLDAATTLVRPDFSPGGNGGELAPEVSGLFEPESVLKAWREFDGNRIWHWASYGPLVPYEVDRFYPERRAPTRDDQR